MLFIEIFFGVAFGIVAGFLLMVNFQAVMSALKWLSIIGLLLSAILVFAGIVYFFRESIYSIFNELALILLSASIFLGYYFAKEKNRSLRNFIEGGHPWWNNGIYRITRWVGLCIIWYVLLCAGLMLLIGIIELFK